MPNLFCDFFIRMKLTCCDIFLDLFSNLTFLVFLKLWLSILLNMQNNDNSYKGAERASPPLSRNIQFSSQLNPLLDVLHWHSIEKPTNFYQTDFWERLIYLFCLHYRTTSQLQKMFQDGNSAIVREISIWWKKRCTVRRCGRTQGQKNISSMNNP